MTARCEKDERLPNGSVIHWSRRFKRKGRWRVPVRCGGCGQERTVAADSASRKKFSGLCHHCRSQGQTQVKIETLPNGSVIYWPQRFRHENNWYVPVCCGGCKQERLVREDNARGKEFSGLCFRCALSARHADFKTDVETLPNGSVIYWPRRFKHEGYWRVPVRCGECGLERTIAASGACGKNFSGLCPDCKALKSVKTDTETLPNGSMIDWSRRFKCEGRWYVPVRCGSCGQERIVTAETACGRKSSGLCFHCSHAARRKPTKTSIETLPSGSIIYWDDQTYKAKRRFVRVRCGGLYCDGHTRYVTLTKVQTDGFTGLCRRCSHYGPRAGQWKGGRRVTTQGYIDVWLPSDHPFYCMTDANGYCREHRLVIAEHLGRPLRDDEIVHHINGDKQDNRLENLEVHVRTKYHAGYRPLEPRPAAKGSTD